MKSISVKRLTIAGSITTGAAMVIFLYLILNKQTFGLINITRPEGLMAHTWQPESSVLVLCAGGVLGLIVSFVRKTYAFTKRCMDIIGSLVAFIVLSPLFLLAAILIKWTSPGGPILFKQTRLGQNGRPFEIYKFRTMRPDAESHTGPVWALKNDSRLIPCGSFLRRTHIDEIPQFINVLKGQMSIIGPRPERPYFIEKLKNEVIDYDKRLLVKPGITGLAQVKHRYDETIRDVKIKVKYDLLYIKKMCLFTDFRIIYLTLLLVVNAL